MLKKISENAYMLTEDTVVRKLDKEVININSEKWKVYLASGWFNPVAYDELISLENFFDTLSEKIDLAAPRRIFVCPPDASQDVQNNVFEGNCHHIRTADFLLVNTRDKDMGTIWEAGYAYAFDKPIVYYCAGLPAGAKFNLMLSRSGIKVCTSLEELKNYFEECFQVGGLIVEEYNKEIE
jgi:hypothetical protein